MLAASRAPVSRVFKIPQSVLVVIHTAALDVLLIKRADAEDFWQSVTGSKDSFDEPWAQTAAREVLEETGIDVQATGCVLTDWGVENRYEIFPRWRARYESGVTHNQERVFGLRVPADTAVRLNPSEHTDYVWLPRLAAADRCFSPSNAEACLMLGSVSLPGASGRRAL